MACAEEIAWRQNCVNDKELKQLAQTYAKTGCNGRHLFNLLKEEVY